MNKITSTVLALCFGLVSGSVSIEEASASTPVEGQRRVPASISRPGSKPKPKTSREVPYTPPDRNTTGGEQFKVKNNPERRN